MHISGEQVRQEIHVCRMPNWNPAVEVVPNEGAGDERGRDHSATTTLRGVLARKVKDERRAAEGEREPVSCRFDDGHARAQPFEPARPAEENE